MKTLIFQHTPEEVPGTLADWLVAKNFPYHIHHMYGAEPLPKASDYDWLIILGGPMNVDEEGKYPWLLTEKEFLRAWLQTGKPVLGICLGGQMLAQALGGRVEKNRVREIGFHEVSRTGAGHPAFAHWPQKMRVFQYHEDRFSLPPGCRTLLSSEVCDHQAFALNDHTVGFQFHPESTRAWIEECFVGLQTRAGETHVQTAEQCAAELPELLPRLTHQFFQFLDDFSNTASAPGR